jgi:hypothetical protein
MSPWGRPPSGRKARRPANEDSGANFEREFNVLDFSSGPEAGAGERVAPGQRYGSLSFQGR